MSLPKAQAIWNVMLDVMQHRKPWDYCPPLRELVPLCREDSAVLDWLDDQLVDCFDKRRSVDLSVLNVIVYFLKPPKFIAYANSQFTEREREAEPYGFWFRVLEPTMDPNWDKDWGEWVPRYFPELCT